MGDPRRSTSIEVTARPKPRKALNNMRARSCAITPKPKPCSFYGLGVDTTVIDQQGAPHALNKKLYSPDDYRPLPFFRNFVPLECTCAIVMGGCFYWMEIDVANEDKSSRLDRVEQILAEMAENHKKEAKENKKRAAENEKRAAENEKRAEENDHRIAENENRSKQPDHDIGELREQAKTAIRQLQRLGKQLGGEGNRWGKIVESLVAGDLITIAREAIGVDIDFVSTRAFPEDESWEVDVLGINHDVAVAVEVKTTLRQSDIDKFLTNTMLPFTRLASKHRRKRIYGVIAYIKVAKLEKQSKVLDYAWSKGLLVIKAMDGINRVVENKKLKLRDYGDV